MQCTKCKTELPENVKFCPECGAPVPKEPDTTITQEAGTAQDNAAIVGTVEGEDVQVGGERHYGGDVKIIIHPPAPDSTPEKPDNSEEKSQPVNTKLLTVIAISLVTCVIIIVVIVSCLSQRPRTLYVYRDKDSPDNHFTPTGFMGDKDGLSLADIADDVRSGATSLRLAYDPQPNGMGWAGIVWQEPGNNWGDKSGGHNLEGLKYVTFWAKGDQPVQAIHFSVGGFGYERGTCKRETEFPDSICPRIEMACPVTNQWSRYALAVPKDNDLSRVIAGFAWVTDRRQALLLDDIVWVADPGDALLCSPSELASVVYGPPPLVSTLTSTPLPTPTLVATPTNTPTLITTPSPTPTPTQVPPTIVVIEVRAAMSHKLNGVGVHVFDNDYGDPRFEDALDTLGLKYLRVPFGPNWDDDEIPEPPACNDEYHEEDYGLMYNFIEQNFNRDFGNRLENAQAISRIAERRKIEMIFLNWRAHKNWLTDPDFKELEEDYVDDYACFVTGVVEFLTENDVIISYLEPTNEPSDTTDTKIPSELYNTFVTLLKRYLHGRGLSDVKILGPGLAYFNHDYTGEIWVNDLDHFGVDAISVWASHAWDPKFLLTEPEEDRGPEDTLLRIKWEEFQRAVEKQEKRFDQPTKPIFITECACVNDPGNAICAVENTLTLLDQGANVVVYWYLREQEWDPENIERALLTESYEEKPTFTALASLLPFISGDDVWILETQVEENSLIKPISFKTTDDAGEGQIVVALINSSSEVENVLINLDEFDIIGVENEIVYNLNTNTTNRNLESVQCQVARCPLELHPNTITTLVLGFRE